MAFWKKSEDPWDRKPGRDWLKDQPKEPKENPIDSLKQWNEDRKAAAKEREAARWLPPEKCPWCGKDMEQGYMLGGRDTVRWYPGILTTKDAWIGSGDRDKRLNVLDESHFIAYKTVWLCRDCKKLVFDMPEPEEDIWSMDRYRYDDPQAPEETKEEETSEE